MTTATRRAPRASAIPARLCAFNAGIQLLWGAILAVSLQARSIELGGSDGVRAYALVASIGAAIATVVQLIVGPLSDRLAARGADRRAFYRTGIVLTLPALGWFYLAGNFTGFALAFFALEIAVNIAGGPYQAVIPDYVVLARRGIASSWMSAYQSLGNAAGVVAAGLLHAPLAVAAAIAVPFATTGAITLDETRRSFVKPMSPPSSRVRMPLRGPLGWLLLSRGLINVGFFTVLGFLEFFVRDSLGFRGAVVTTWTGLIFLTFTLAAVGGAVLFARPTDRYDKRAIVSVAIGAIALALAALAASQNLPFAFIAAGAAGVAWGGFVTADWALATSLLPGGAMATAMGVWNVATAVPQVIAPLIGARVVERFDAISAGLGPRAALVAATIEFVIGAALIWRLPRA